MKKKETKRMRQKKVVDKKMIGFLTETNRKETNSLESCRSVGVGKQTQTTKAKPDV